MMPLLPAHHVRRLILGVLLASGCSSPTRPPILGTSSDASTDVPVAAPDAPRPDAAVAVDVVRPPLQGGFIDLTESSRVAPLALGPGDGSFLEPEATIGLFADFDGDGRVEVILGHTRAEPGALTNRRARVYRYDRAAGQLVPAGEVAAAGELSVQAVTDLDGDGRADLISAVAQGRVAWGRGGGEYGPPEPLIVLPGGSNWELAHLYLDDLDADGWLDVLVANRFCGPSSISARLLLRTGARRFEDVSRLLPVLPGMSPYAVMSLSFGSERVIGQFGQSCGDPAPSFFRERGRDELGYPQYEAFDPVPTDAYFRMMSGSGMPASLSQFAPMAAALGDVDRDGRADLSISLDPYLTLFRSGDRWPFADSSETWGPTYLTSPRGTKMIPWGVALVDVDRDGELDVVAAHGNDHTAWFNPGFSLGPQSTSLHLGVGGVRFTDVTSRVGLGRMGQWRSLAVGDLDDDGDVDLIVGGQGELPRVYRNDLLNAGHGITFRLHGTSSNHLGVGARVTVTAAPGGAARTYWAGSHAAPYSWDEPLVFAGLGAASTADRVRITWPSGTEQELRDLAADRVHDVVEPRLFELAPASRHAPADGRSTVTLTVTPRRPDGTARPDGVVTVALAGPGRLAGPVARAGDSWRVAIEAPSAPGSTAIEVRVDGVAATVRPRVWWDAP